MGSRLMARPQQTTSIRVAASAHQAAVQRAKEVHRLDLTRVVELIIRDALRAGIAFEDEVLKSHGSRDYKRTIGFDPAVWQNEEGEYYPGYEEAQSRARIQMIVGAINIYASDRVELVLGTTLRGAGERPDTGARESKATPADGQDTT